MKVPRPGFNTHKKTDDRIFFISPFFPSGKRKKKVTDCRRRTSCVVLGSIWTSPPSLYVYCLHVFWCCEALLRLLLLSRAQRHWTEHLILRHPSYSCLCLIFERGEFKQGDFIFRKKEIRIVNEVGRISPSLVVAVTSSFLHQIRSKHKKERKRKKLFNFF